MSASRNQNPARAGQDWPPVVVASVFQTGLNLMRDLERKGVRVVGVDCVPANAGFRSVYGQSRLCPDPDTHPEAWLAFMRALSRELGTSPVLIPAADQFVSAVGRHREALREDFLFSADSAALQAALATKEHQYALAAEHGFPRPRTAYIHSAADLRAFAASANYPSLLKPRHQREWDALPEGNPLRGRKVMTADSPEALAAHYAHIEAFRPEVMAQEIILGPDSNKYCYLSVYASSGARLGFCVVREFFSYPLHFGSASVVQPVVDDEIEQLCDRFLREIGYAGLCEIEVKRDDRDGNIRLIEVNPRFSGTGDCAIYSGVETGWLHYLDLAGKDPAPVEASRFDFRHVTLVRHIPVFEKLKGAAKSEWLSSFRPPVEWFDFDLRDWRVTAATLRYCARSFAGGLLRRWNLRSTRRS